jgi:small-conductance mechanosensitive channel
MPGTDFFDDDLVRQRNASRTPVPPRADDAVETLGQGGASDDVPVRAISDLNLTRMARHKHQVTEQSTVALQELERLKKRQEELEQEKRALEDLRRKHDDFDRGKREMTDHLKRSLVGLEREEVEFGRLVEQLGATRKRFKALLSGLEEIKEESWAEEEIREQLNRSLGIIEDTRMEYNKALAKIDAIKGSEKTPSSATPGSNAILFEERAPSEDKPFAFWIKVGLAVSLPVMITLIVLALLFMIGSSNGWF